MFVHSTVDDAGLSPSAFRVLAHLCRCANPKEGWWARPGVRNIAKTCRLDDETVKRAIAELEQAGFLQVDRGRGRGCKHRYYPLLDHERRDDETVRIGGTVGDAETVPPMRTGVPSIRTVVDANCPVVSPRVSRQTGQKDIQEGNPLYETDLSLGDASTVPENLDTPEFRTAWAKWIAYLAEKKRLAPPRSSLEALWDQLERVGVECAVVMIQTAMANNWNSINVPQLVKILTSPAGSRWRGTNGNVFPDPNRKKGQYDGAF